MTTLQLIELAAALAIFIAGVWLYRARRPSGGRSAPRYGSQGAVLLFAVAAILAVHALGLLEYRPSPAELEAIRQ